VPPRDWNPTPARGVASRWAWTQVCTDVYCSGQMAVEQIDYIVVVFCTYFKEAQWLTEIKGLR
jgi:hypothetical protein